MNKLILVAAIVAATATATACVQNTTSTAPTAGVPTVAPSVNMVENPACPAGTLIAGDWCDMKWGKGTAKASSCLMDMPNHGFGQKSCIPVAAKARGQ